MDDADADADDSFVTHADVDTDDANTRTRALSCPFPFPIPFPCPFLMLISCVPLLFPFETALLLSLSQSLMLAHFLPSLIFALLSPPPLDGV